MGIRGRIVGIFAVRDFQNIHDDDSKIVCRAVKSSCVCMKIKSHQC